MEGSASLGKQQQKQQQQQQEPPHSLSKKRRSPPGAARQKLSFSSNSKDGETDDGDDELEEEEDAVEAGVEDGGQSILLPDLLRSSPQTKNPSAQALTAALDAIAAGEAGTGAEGGPAAAAVSFKTSERSRFSSSNTENELPSSCASPSSSTPFR